MSNTPHAHPRRSLVFVRADRQQRILRPPHLVSAGEPFSNESRLAVGGALNAELVYPVANGVGMEIRSLRGALWPIRHSISLPQGGQDTAFRPTACMFVLSNSDFVISEHCTTDGLQKRQVPSGSKPRFPSAAESSMSRTRSSQLHGASAFFQSQLASRQSAWAMSRRESARSPSSLDLANLW